jgi:hypothetical protein
MPKRRLVLKSENLTPLQPDELSSVAGAISYPHPLCALSLQYSHCPQASCGIGCTAQCPPPASETHC